MRDAKILKKGQLFRKTLLGLQVQQNYMMVFRDKTSLSSYLNTSEMTNIQLGLVPTMGYLHEGHLSIIERAVAENKRVVVSVFVNPTQFESTSDLNAYPRDPEGDLKKISSVSSKVIVYMPPSEDVYTDKAIIDRIDLQGLDHYMEGVYRSGHFQGVAQVIRFLFDLIQPDKAYFGEKDFQQLQIVRHLTTEWEMPINIIGCPIYREKHGLAMSSRNERLSNNLRRRAGIIYQILQQAQSRYSQDFSILKNWIKKRFEEQKDFELEYIEIADEKNLIPINKKIKTPCRLFVAVIIEEVRLIDNIPLY